MCVVVWCRSSADGDMTLCDPFYSLEQQDQREQLDQGKYSIWVLIL